MTKDPSGRDYRRGTGKDKNAGAAEDASLVELLTALARAVRQFRTYPATSPLCIDAIDACDRAFAAYGETASLVVRVTPREVIVGDAKIGRGTIIEQELARPLHRARVASLEVDRSASRRDWTRLCADLFRLSRLRDTRVTLGELLAEGGVAAIVPRTAPRPEVLDVGAPPPPVRALVERERERQASAVAGGPAQYFYPPDKGWVRIDPTVALDTVSLLDLAVLVDDPADLAMILMRLTDDDADQPAGRAAAVEQKYGDVVALLSALDPRLARILFAKLARAVLQLEPDCRKALLQRTILPGLLDGRSHATAVLTDFPDVDLADALCLLLDLETAVPEVLSAALDRLALPAERRHALAPMIEQKLASGTARREPADGRPLESYAGALVRVAAENARSFAEFSAFDLSINPQTASALAAVGDAIRAADPDEARLACFASLSRIEANPAIVIAFLDQVVALLGGFVRRGRWADVARWATRFRDAASAAAEARAEVADAIRNALARLADRDLVVGLAHLCGDEGGARSYADGILAAVGTAIVPAWVAALDRPADYARARGLLPAICTRAPELAPALVDRLASCGPAAARAIVTALGFTHSRCEAAIAAQLARGDEGLGREAIRALVRIGSREAAATVGEQLRCGPAWARSAAEDALWRFPHVTALVVARDLLGRRDFVVGDPQLAGRLLDRAAQAHDVDLDPVLARLVPLRFRFWNPALVRIAAKARELRQ